MNGFRHLIGVDPGFASFGFGVVRLLPDTEEVVEMGVIRTKKSSLKQRTLAADDNVRRCREIASAMLQLVKIYDPVAICGESMSYPRNASAAAKVAMTWGIVCTIAEENSLPVFQASPQKIKSKLTGTQKASKSQVQDALRELYPVTDFDRLLEKFPMGEHEHPWDALASVVTCLDAEPVRLVRRYAFEGT